MEEEQLKSGLNIHIYPARFENESRMLKMTKFLVRNKIANHVLVIGLINGEGTYKEAIDGSRDVLRVGTKFINKNILLKVLNFIEWYMKILVFLFNKNVEMINCHSLSALPLCVLLKFRHKCLLIYEPHELETETKGCKGGRKIFARIVEKFFFKFADQLIVVSHSIAKAYKQMYRMRSTPPVVLNCPNYIAPIRTNIFRKHFGIDSNATIFLYQGDLSEGRGVSVILEAFKNSTDPNKVIVFMGSGPLEGEIRNASLNNNNIFYHPAVPHNVVLNYTASADVGLHFIQNTCLNHYYCMPNKLFEYLMAGLPVIVSDMYDMSSFVKQTGTGVIVCDDKSESIIGAIYQLDEIGTAAIKKNVFESAKEHCWETQEKVLAITYDKLLREEFF